MAEKAKLELTNLKDDVALVAQNPQAIYDAFVAGSSDSAPTIRLKALRPRTLLSGHLEKVVAVAWSPDGTQLVSAAHDDNLLVWSTQQRLKLAKIPTARGVDGELGKLDPTLGRSSRFVMCVDFAPDGRHVACGGLDDICAVFPSSGEGRAQDLRGHQGYISGCRFVDGGSNILTCSGDSSCRLWDISKGVSVQQYNGHKSDVTCMDLSRHPGSNIFATSSTDGTVRLWDIRSGAINSFEAPAPTSGSTLSGCSEVDQVALHPSEHLVAGGQMDGTIFLADIRQGTALKKFQSSMSGITSLTFSASGRLLFAADEDSHCVMWDVYSGEIAGQLKGHDKCVSAVRISPDGTAVATASFDKTIKIWS